MEIEEEKEKILEHAQPEEKNFTDSSDLTEKEKNANSLQEDTKMGYVYKI